MLVKKKIKSSATKTTEQKLKQELKKPEQKHDPITIKGSSDRSERLKCY